MSTVNEYNARKRQLVLMDWSNDSGAIDLKMEGSVLEKKKSFKMLGLSLPDWPGAITLYLLLKRSSRKLKL